MVSNISDLTWAKPPTSSQVTLGIFGAPMLSEYESLAFPRATSKSLVVMDMEEKDDKSSFKVLGPSFQLYRFNGLLQIDSYAVFIARSMDAALARATRSCKSPASRAAVWIARC